MLSRSTRSKRRRNAVFYGLTNCIKLSVIEQRQGTRFYLVSLQVEQGSYIHLEARGDEGLRVQLRKMRERCKQIASGPEYEASRVLAAAKSWSRGGWSNAQGRRTRHSG